VHCTCHCTYGSRALVLLLHLVKTAWYTQWLRPLPPVCALSQRPIITGKQSQHRLDPPSRTLSPPLCTPPSSLHSARPLRAQAAKKEETRKRGKAEFYTLDPKFDERFQLGYQMAGDQVGCGGWRVALWCGQQRSVTHGGAACAHTCC